MVSAALSQGVNMKEERWRMICEGLGLDYDEVVADMPEQETKDDTSDKREHSHREEDPGAAGVGEIMQMVDLKKEKEDRDNLFLLAMYAEGRLAKDIEEGMKVDPMKLWGILDALKKIKDSTMTPE